MIVRTRRLLLCLLIAAAASGCTRPGEPTATVPGTPPPSLALAAPFLVSNPVAGPAEARVGSATASLIDERVYIAAPPGTFPDFVSASVRVARTGFTALVNLLDGGLDPVAVPARRGDTITVELRRAAGSSATYQMLVPGNRAPVIVRTVPPRSKRDVPLNTRVLVVFSEPIDPRSLTAQSVSLRSGAQIVPGTLTFATPDQTTAEFVPIGNLQGLTDYELVVTTSITDREGTVLDAPARVPFTTEDSGPTVSAIDIVASTTLDIAAVAGDAAEEDVEIVKVNLGAFGIAQDIDFDRFERWSSCPDTIVGNFVCAAKVRGSFMATRSYAYFTSCDGCDFGLLQPGYDPNTTAGATFSWSLAGSITRGKFTGYVTRWRVFEISTPSDSNGTVNVFGMGSDREDRVEQLRTTFLRDSAGPNRTYILTATFNFSAIAPARRLPDAWPTSGTVTRDYTVTRIDAAGTTFTTRRAIVTFNGTQFVDLIVSQNADNAIGFTLDLATGKVTPKAAAP